MPRTALKCRFRCSQRHQRHPFPPRPHRGCRPHCTAQPIRGMFSDEGISHLGSSFFTLFGARCLVTAGRPPSDSSLSSSSLSSSIRSEGSAYDFGPVRARPERLPSLSAGAASGLGFGAALLPAISCHIPFSDSAHPKQLAVMAWLNFGGNAIGDSVGFSSGFPTQEMSEKTTIVSKTWSLQGRHVQNAAQGCGGKGSFSYQTMPSLPLTFSFLSSNVLAFGCTIVPLSLRRPSPAQSM